MTTILTGVGASTGCRRAKRGDGRPRRFHRHQHRRSGRLQRLLGALKHAVQDTAWLTATDRDSFHWTWFELREDLIATLGIHRG
ncbi:hypothetical protein [Arthrobacter sp. EpRS71]|uniref:hypothetical protein n=1 Tax=Arthrobacter sp. EpRS71 TaxID=1743141 RepID=UPI001E47F102|nr:hypothetical protein [Arthrobacter sp. EpRS71]